MTHRSDLAPSGPAAVPGGRRRAAGRRAVPAGMRPRRRRDDAAGTPWHGIGDFWDRPSPLGALPESVRGASRPIHRRDHKRWEFFTIQCGAPSSQECSLRPSDSATGRLLSDRGRFRASVVGSFPVGEPRRVVPDLLFRGGQASPSATRRSLSATPAQAIDQGSSPTPAPARPTRPTAPARAARTRAPSHRPRPDAAPPPNRSASAASAPWA